MMTVGVESGSGWAWLGGVCGVVWFDMWRVNSCVMKHGQCTDAEGRVHTHTVITSPSLPPSLHHPQVNHNLRSFGSLTRNDVQCMMYNHADGLPETIRLGLNHKVDQLLKVQEERRFEALFPMKCWESSVLSDNHGL